MPDDFAAIKTEIEELACRACGQQALRVCREGLFPIAPGLPVPVFVEQDIQVRCSACGVTGFATLSQLARTAEHYRELAHA